MKAGPLASRSADPNQLRQLPERVINCVSRETLMPEIDKEGWAISTATSNLAGDRVSAQHRDDR